VREEEREKKEKKKKKKKEFVCPQGHFAIECVIDVCQRRQMTVAKCQLILKNIK